MPANLTPQYKEAEERYRQAKTVEDKLAALEEMLAIIPKHKGTEHLQGDIKSRMAKLRRQEEQKRGPGKRTSFYNVEREGGGQVVLVGPPNSGKSSLLARLTNAQPDIGDYPFTTQRPMPGMMEYEDIKIQIVDIPPITEEFTEPWVAAIVRNADAALLILDMSEGSVLDQTETTLNVLEKFRVELAGWDRETFGEDEPGMPVRRKTILLANKMDKPDSADDLDVIRELYGGRFPIIPVSTTTAQGLEDVKQQVFQMLQIVRVYTKIPGKPADMGTPYVIAEGSTLQELATMVHKDFAENLKFARVWGRGKFDGQLVGKDHVLEDGDIIELHA